MDDHTKFLGGCHDCRWRRRYFHAMSEQRLTAWVLHFMLATLSVLLLAGNRIEITLNHEDGFRLVVEPAFMAKDAEEQG